MKYFNVKFKNIIKFTDKAVCLEKWSDDGIVWLPIKFVKENLKYTKGIAYIIPEWICKKNGLYGKEYELYHHPKKIEPEYNQEAIDDVKL